MEQFIGKTIKSISFLPTWETALAKKQNCEELVIVFDDDSKMIVSPAELANVAEENDSVNENTSQYLDIKLYQSKAKKSENNPISNNSKTNETSESEMVYSKRWFWRSKPRKI